MARGIDVIRCKECAENLPLLFSVLGILKRASYRCGACETSLEIERPAQSDGSEG